MLSLGLATRLAALAITVDLLVAVFGVHLPKWEWTEGKAEYPALMAMVATFIAVRGGGSLSLDARLWATSHRSSAAFTPPE